MLLHICRTLLVCACLSFGLCETSYAAERNLPEEIKAIVSICTSGFSVKSRGKLEAGIARFLSNQIEAKGEIDIAAGGAEGLLEQFENEDLKIEALKILKSCVIEAIGTVYNFREAKNISKTQQSDKILVPETLLDVEAGQLFALAIGQSTSLAGGRAIIAVRGHRNDGAVPLVTLTEESLTHRRQLSIGDKISFRDRSCWVTYYAGNTEEKTYSFKLECRS